METEFAGYRSVPARHVPVAGRVDVEAPAADRATVGDAAAVQRAVRITDGQEVAIKVYPAAQRTRAHREAEIAAAIDHPHVLVPVDLVDAAGVTGVVVPWARGGSLAALIACRKRLTWPEALTVLIPLADALSCAHEKGWVHGDLSAANVLFDGSGRPLLADFGSSRAASETGVPVCATPGDVAPELVRGAVPSPASDLFSLGSVALTCLTGLPAWPADTLEDVMVQSAAGQWPDLAEHMAPEALRRLVRRLLDSDPAKRGSAAALAVDLRRCGYPEPVRLATGQGDSAPGAEPVRAATMVRADAPRPPAALRQHRRLPRWRRPIASVGARLSVRGAGALALTVAALVGAVVVGLRWGQAPASAVTVPAPSSVSGLPAHGGSMPVAAGSVAGSVAAAAGSVGGSIPVAAGSVAGSAPGSPAAPAPSSEPGQTGTGSVGAGAAPSPWAAVVARLDDARSAAFSARDAALLDAVYTAGAQARKRDQAAIATLREHDLVPDGARHEVLAVRQIAAADDGVIVAVREAQPPIAVRNAAGTIVTRTAAVPESEIVLHLELGGTGYRIARLDSE